MKLTTFMPTLLLTAAMAMPASDSVSSNYTASIGSNCNETMYPGCRDGASYYDEYGNPREPEWIRCNYKCCPGCQFGAVCRD